MKVFVEVKITYRDEKIEKFKCCDAPGTNPDWITIFPYDNPTSRELIPREAVQRIEYKYIGLNEKDSK